MGLPRPFLDQLMARSDIVDVVGSYVQLKRKGRNYFGLCPFHSEKTGSFSVDPGKQMFYCFGCKKGGDAVRFIMEAEHLPFLDAVAFLARRAGLEMPEADEDERKDRRRRQRLFDLNREAARFYHRQLMQPQGAAVQAYLSGRKIRRGTAVRFGMGASLPQWDALIQAMREKGYTKEELLSAGLVSAGKGGRLYDRFRGRLMLPVVDIRGNVVAFGSRAVDGTEPKYMNSNESPIYAKRRELYGLNLAKNTKRPNLILCEGNLDVVTLHQAGFDNAVASMGTALTEEQIQLLARFTKQLVLCYDNDEAGKTATERALQLLDRSSLSVRVLQLPRRQASDGAFVKQDADDFIKFQGRDAFERLLSGSENGVEFRLEETAAKYDLQDPEERVAFCREAGQIVSALPGAVEREIYTARAAEMAGITPAAMALEIQQTDRRRRRKQEAVQLRADLSPAAAMQPKTRALRYEDLRSARAEEGLVQLLLTDDTLFSDAPPIPPEDFSSPLLRRAYQQLWAEHDQGRQPRLSALGQDFSPEELDHLYGVCLSPVSLPNAPQALRDYIAVIRDEAQKRQGSADPLLAANEKYKKRGKTDE